MRSECGYLINFLGDPRSQNVEDWTDPPDIQNESSDFFVSCTVEGACRKGSNYNNISNNHYYDKHALDTEAMSGKC